MVNQSFDLKVVSTKETLIGVINNSGLPMSVIDMLIDDISDLVKVELKNQLARQKEEYDRALYEESLAHQSHVEETPNPSENE